MVDGMYDTPVNITTLQQAADNNKAMSDVRCDDPTCAVRVIRLQLGESFYVFSFKLMFND